MTEGEMVGLHHWLNGHALEWGPWVGDGQGSLACCSLWGHKESDMTEWLNWSNTERLDQFILFQQQDGAPFSISSWT